MGVLDQPVPRERVDREYKKHRRFTNLPFLSDLSGDYTSTYVNAEDADVPGISTPEEIQKAIDGDRPSFTKFVHALNAAGVKALTAIDAKNAESLVEAGDAMDKACENCHLKYWYPNSPRP